MNISYALGMSLTLEALLHQPQQVRVVYYASSLKRDEAFLKLEYLCKQYDIPFINDDHLINKLSVKENCYAVAEIEVIKKELATKQHLLFHGATDAGTLGTCLRCAISFNFKDIVLIDCLPLTDTKLIRASMGAFFQCNFNEFKTLIDYQNEYLKQQLFLFKQEANLPQSKKDEAYTLIFDFQNELNVDDCFGINMDNEISLAQSCAIICHHLYIR